MSWHQCWGKIAVKVIMSSCYTAPLCPKYGSDEFIWLNQKENPRGTKQLCGSISIHKSYFSHQTEHTWWIKKQKHPISGNSHESSWLLESWTDWSQCEERIDPGFTHFQSSCTNNQGFFSLTMCNEFRPPDKHNILIHKEYSSDLSNWIM